MAHDVLATLGEMSKRGAIVLAVGLWGLTSCEPDAAVAPTHFTCAAANEAPLPDGEGGHRCLRVGARENVRAELWPLFDGLPEPRVFVQPDAPAGGDGSQARPVRDFAAALAMSPATVVVSRGAHRLASPVALTSALTVVGADPATAVFELSAGAGLSTTAALTLRTVGLRSATAGADDAVLRASAGATLTLDDVSIEGGATGVLVESAALLASHLTVRRTTRRDVDLSGATRAVIRSALLRDSAGSGLSISDARVFFSEGLVATHGRKGIVLQGTGDATLGFGDCRRDPMASTGANDCVTDVASLGNGSVGLSIEGPRALEVRRLMLADTRAVDATGSAEGMFVSRGGEVTLDPEISLDAQQGYGTEVTDNGRFGVLIDGGEVTATPSRLSMRGATLRRNPHGGVFLQNNAVASRVDFSRFEENGWVGLGVVESATIVEIGCNGFLRTRPVEYRTVTPTGTEGLYTLGDGLSLSGARTVQITANRFEDNGRYAAVFLNANGSLDRNQGSGNRYPLGVYASPSLVVADTNRVTGRESAPDVLPGIAGVTR